MKVSIIVPIYNVESALEYCLDSIQAQNYSDYEVIMINDGSTDKSPEIAKQYVERDNKFKLYTTPNRGLASARNEGLKYVTGDIISFVDSDDQIAPNYLSIVVKEFQQNSDIDLIHLSHAEVTESISHIKNGNVVEVKKKTNAEAIKSFLESEIISTAWANVVKARIIKEHNLRFSDGKLFEDENFNVKLFSYSKQVLFLSMDNGPYYYLVGRSGSIMNRVFAKKRVQHFKDRLFMINDQYQYLSKVHILSKSYITTWYLYKLIWIYNDYYPLHAVLPNEFNELKKKIIRLYRNKDTNLSKRQKLQYYRVINRSFNKVMVTEKKIASVYRKKEHKL